MILEESYRAFILFHHQPAAGPTFVLAKVGKTCSLLDLSEICRRNISLFTPHRLQMTLSSIIFLIINELKI